MSDFVLFFFPSLAKVHVVPSFPFLAQMHFNVRASEVSALAGRNMYKTIRQTIKDVVTMYVPSSHQEYQQSDQLKQLTARMEEQVRMGPCYGNAVSRRELNEDICRLAEQESMDIFDRFTVPLPPHEKHRLRKSIRTVYLKDRGMLMEGDALKRLALLNIHWRPTEKRQRFFQRTFTSTVGRNNLHDIPFSYTINGCVDGMEFNDRGQICGLIEIKSRKEKVQYAIHDLDQIMMYLVISGLPRGRLVQDVNGHLFCTYIMTFQEAMDRWCLHVRPVVENTLRLVMRDIYLAARDREASWRPMPPTFHEDVPEVVYGHGNRPIVTYVAEPAKPRAEPEAARPPTST